MQRSLFRTATIAAPDAPRNVGAEQRLPMIAAGQPMSFFAMLGVMSLMGIIINNAIVLINQINIERTTRPIHDAIVAAAKARAKPIMLTSLTTIFGLAPMAVAGGNLFEPMATIMIGGLAVASPLTLLVVPPLCHVLLRPRGRNTAPPDAPSKGAAA